MVSKRALVIGVVVALPVLVLSVRPSVAQIMPGTGGLTVPEVKLLLQHQRQQQGQQQQCCKLRAFDAGPGIITPAPMPAMPDIPPPQSADLSKGFADFGSAIDGLIARHRTAVSANAQVPDGPNVLVDNATSLADARVTADAVCSTDGMVAGPSQALRDGILFTCVGR